MRRRELLRVAPVVALGSTAGCLGYTVQSTEEQESRKERIDSLQSKLDTARSTLNETEAELNDTEEKLESVRETRSELQSEVSNLESQLDSLKADREEAQAKAILRTYSYGIGQQNNAVDAYNRAYRQYEEEKFSTATINFGQSHAHYESTANIFMLAEENAEKWGFETAKTYCNDAYQSTWKESQANYYYMNASYAYSNGNYSSGDSYLEQADIYSNQAERYEIRDLGAVEDAVGYTINVEDPSTSQDGTRI